MDQDDLRALKESRPTWLEDGFGLKGPPTPQPRAVQSPLDDAFYGRHVRQGYTSGGGGVGGGGASATVTPPTAPPLPPTTTTPPEVPPQPVEGADFTLAFNLWPSTNIFADWDSITAGWDWVTFVYGDAEERAYANLIPADGATILLHGVTLGRRDAYHGQLGPPKVGEGIIFYGSEVARINRPYP